MALVRDLSTDDSPAFVNGILGNLMRNKPGLVEADSEPGPTV